MTLELTETETSLVYTDLDTGGVITVQKDDNNIDVHQVVPIASAGGQTWQILKTYLDLKLSES